MAATNIPVNSTSRTTAAATTTAGDTVNGNSFTNDGRTDLWFRKTTTGTGSFVIVSTQTVGSEALAVADLTVSVAASQDWTPLGYFDPTVYGSTVTITSVSANTIEFKAWKHA
jgi:hypothetical protein